MKKLGGICSACKQKVSEEHKLAEIKNLNDNKEKLNREIQELALQLSQKEKEGIEITNFINLINQSKVALSKIQYMIEKKKEKDKKIKELFANKEQLEKILQNKKIDIENRKKILLESLKESQSKFNTIIEKLAILKDVKQKYLDIEKRYNIANSELQQLIILKTRSEEIKNQINKIEIKVKDLEVQLNSLKEEEYLYIELTKALHYNGIPSLVLANWLEELQYLCNEYLSFFSDNRISLTFSLQKVNKSNNNVVDTLDVIVSDENGSRNIELYSGGEKTRIYLSIRLALLKLLTMKNFNNVNILIIDELSDLDQLGMKLFLEALKNLESYFSQIFFVTHITELTNEIKNNVILRKDITDEQKSC
jgi:DNA repair exonuclease SbcCD ATPase subunit